MVAVIAELLRCWALIGFSRQMEKFLIFATLYQAYTTKIQVIVISLPGGWSFYTFVSGIARHQCARPHPREEYITCYLGNITVEEKILICCLGNRLYYLYIVP